MPIDHVNYSERREISVTFTEYQAVLLKQLVTNASRTSNNHSAKVAFDHILTAIAVGEHFAAPSPAKPVSACRALPNPSPR
jgi:hypothetical protein